MRSRRTWRSATGRNSVANRSPFVRRHLIRLHVRVEQRRDPGVRDVERIRAHHVVDQLLADRGVGVPLGMLFEILANRRRQRVERIEVADLARERVVERRDRLALHVLERHANRLRLSALRFVRKIIRPLHRLLGVAARHELHHQLFDARNRLTAAEHDAVLARRGNEPSSSDVANSTVTMSPSRGFSSTGDQDAR